MSAFSKNPFDLLGDDDAEADQIVVAKTEEKKPAPDQQQVKVDKSRAQRGEARIRHEYPQRGGLRTVASVRDTPPAAGDSPAGGGRVPREPREQWDRNVGPRFQRQADQEGGEFPPRTSRGGHGGVGGGRGGRGGSRGRGRQFDRHSGTGLVDSEKKDTMGWGDATVPWSETEKPSENDLAPAVTEVIPEEKPAEEPAATETATPVEPEEKVITLNEYLAEQAQKALAATLPEARKPNEGVDDSQWKDAVPLEKSEEEDVFFAGKETTAKSKIKAKKEKVFLEIEQRFTERPGRGRFERRVGDGERRRGGNFRGGDRRSGGFGGADSYSRGGRQSNGNVNVDDVNAFPSLGSK